MNDWRRELRESIESPGELADALGVTVERLEEIIKKYPMRITPHVARLIREKGEVIARQVIPAPEELEEDPLFQADPLNEDGDMPVPGLVHRYPDRVLLFVTNQCPIYCRFCTRKRFVGKPGTLTPKQLESVVEYLREHPEVRDIILSGGDPLMVVDLLLERILKALRTVPHLEIIRLGTRVPGTLPERITDELCAMLKKYHPIYMNLHFNHPDELTPEVEAACGRLADAGIPLGAQTVLLKGINDDPEVMKRLGQRLLKVRVKPYYLYQTDLVTGTGHFRTPVEAGFEVIRALRGHTSGMAVPHYVIDAPGGGGKVAILPPDTLLSINEKEVVVQNYEGKTVAYPQPEPNPAPFAVPYREAE